MQYACPVLAAMHDRYTALCYPSFGGCTAAASCNLIPAVNRNLWMCTGHDMTVYAVKWNNIHQRIFLSASADWTLKLWEGDNPRPVMSFDLNNPVGDAAWSPHSATVFAAVTDDGKVTTRQ